MSSCNCIDVIREQEKLLYRIMKDVERDGESIASSNNPEWKRVSGKLSKTQELQEKDLLFPILKAPRYNRKSDIRIVKIPKNVEVHEEIRGSMSRFPFKFKKIPFH